MSESTVLQGIIYITTGGLALSVVGLVGWAVGSWLTGSNGHADDKVAAGLWAIVLTGLVLALCYFVGELILS